MMFAVLFAVATCCGMVGVYVVGTGSGRQLQLPLSAGLPFAQAADLTPAATGAAPLEGNNLGGATRGQSPAAAGTPGAGPTQSPVLTPTSTPVPTDVPGVRISDAKLNDQQVLSTGGQSFAARLTFAISAARYDGLWGELDGDPSGARYYPSQCANGACTFVVTLSCAVPTRQKMTFHSGIYWRYTSFVLTKPAGCGG